MTILELPNKQSTEQYIRHYVSTYKTVYGDDWKLVVYKQIVDMSEVPDLLKQLLKRKKAS